MNLASLSAALNKQNLLSNIDPSLQSIIRGQQESSGAKTDTPNLFSSIPGMNSLYKNQEESKFPVLIEDSDLMIYEPTKKLKTQENSLNIHGSNNLVPNRNSKDQGNQKKQNPTQAKNAEPLVTADKSWLEEHRSSKDSNESMSTYNSNCSITEPAGKKEIIELEDSPEDDDVQETLNLPPDNLVMTDDVISGLNKDKERIAQQYQYLMRGPGNQVSENSFQTQAAEQVQQSAAWAQLMQLNQVYNSLSRNSMNSLGGGLSFLNMNSAMTMGMPYMYNNLLRQAQAQAQYPFLGNDVSSILGKRNAPYEDFASLIKRNLQRGNPVSQGAQSEIIILDDEEEPKVDIPEKKKRSKARILGSNSQGQKH